MSSDETPAARSLEGSADSFVGRAPNSGPRASDGRVSDSSELAVNLTAPEAVAGLLAERRFTRLARSLLGERTDMVLAAARSCETGDHFQARVGLPMLDALLARTSNGVSYRGEEHLLKGKGSLFISNHRDILLDSALLSRLMIMRGLIGPHPAIGDNLLQSGWIRNFFRLVESFVIRRNLKGKELYAHSRQVSEYVRELISSGQSVWIAQRQGRTRDGSDRTEPALLRMLLLAYERSRDPNEAPLPVTPVAVSYEYEPCDVFKAACVIGTSVRNSPVDRGRRDTAHMLGGLMQCKGRICLTVREPLLVHHNAASARGSDRADFIADLGSRVDREIVRGYMVWPGNYVAHDLLHGEAKYQDRYSVEDRERFLDYLGHTSGRILAEPPEAHRALLNLYARPVDEAQKNLD